MVQNRSMLPAAETEWVIAQAKELGFDLSGVAPVGAQLENAPIGERNSAEEAKDLEHLPDIDPFGRVARAGVTPER